MHILQGPQRPRGPEVPERQRSAHVRVQGLLQPCQLPHRRLQRGHEGPGLLTACTHSFIAAAWHALLQSIMGCWSSPLVAVQVMVPLSNAEILASSSAQYISTTVQEVCWDSSRRHGACVQHAACLQHAACMQHAAPCSPCWPGLRRPSTAQQTWHGVSFLLGAGMHCCQPDMQHKAYVARGRRAEQ